MAKKPKPAPTSTPWTTSEPRPDGDRGNFGYLSTPSAPLLDDVNLEKLGLNFTVKKPVKKVEPEVETEIKQAVVTLDDQRTNEDIKAELLQLISNALDLPETTIVQSRAALTDATGELRDFVMTKIVPTVLAVNPALMSVQQMIPRLFENGADMEVDLQAEQLAGFARATATLATRLKIIDMLGLSDDVRARMILRMVPVTDGVKERP